MLTTLIVIMTMSTCGFEYVKMILMSNFYSTFLPKLYWPLIIAYSIVLLCFLILYFIEINNWSDRNYYIWMNFKRIFITSCIIFGSLLMKYFGNEKASQMIIFIPTGIFMAILLAGLFMLYLFSKSNS